MSNEEKILSMLIKMQSDIERLNSEVEAIRNNEILQAAERNQKRGRRNTYDALKAMSELLNDDEKKALGKYMEAEAARKAALYG